MKKTKKVVKSSKAVKETKKTLKQLIAQDKKELAKYCTAKCFNTIETIEEQLTRLFSNSKVQNHIKNKVLDSVKCGLTRTNAMKIELIFNNDSTLEDNNEIIKKSIDDFIAFLEDKVKNMK